MAQPIRGEMWNLALALESSYGVDPGTGNYDLFPGVFQNATLPDPATEFNNFWLLGVNSYRNWYISYRGRRTSQGSLPEMLLLNGSVLSLPVGEIRTIGAVVSGTTSTVTATSRGDMFVTVSGMLGFVSGAKIQVQVL
jgi:hypothetical protein